MLYDEASIQLLNLLARIHAHTSGKKLRFCSLWSRDGDLSMSAKSGKIRFMHDPFHGNKVHGFYVCLRAQNG